MGKKRKPRRSPANARLHAAAAVMREQQVRDRTDQALDAGLRKLPQHFNGEEANDA